MKQLIKCFGVGCLVVLASTYCKPASADQIPVPSEKWHVVSHDSNNNILSIDQGTLTRQGNFVGFWTQVVSPINYVAVSRTYTVGDCSSNVFHSLWLAQADRQGKVLANTQVNDSAVLNSLVLDAVCQNQNPVVQTSSFQAQIEKSLLHSFEDNRQTTTGLFSRNRNYAFK
jgi:hypothetical protein